jgi:hypothetical protein
MGIPSNHDAARDVAQAKTPNLMDRKPLLKGHDLPILL